jgi:hypothetical protein
MLAGLVYVALPHGDALACVSRILTETNLKHRQLAVEMDLLSVDPHLYVKKSEGREITNP